MMKRMLGWMAVGLMGLAGPAFAQAQQGQLPQQGQMQQCPMMFNPSAIDTVSGEIVGIDSIGGMMGAQGRNVILMVKTSDGVTAINVGPLSYLQRQNVNFKLGDRIDVRGARVEYEGLPTLIATNITQANGRTLSLRNDQGVPMWRVQGRNVPQQQVPQQEMPQQQYNPSYTP